MWFALDKEVKKSVPLGVFIGAVATVSIEYVR